MKFNAACLQITSNDNPKENLDQVIHLTEESINSGADFVLTPENTFLMTQVYFLLHAQLQHES